MEISLGFYVGTSKISWFCNSNYNAKVVSQNAYNQGYAKGREDERVDTAAAIVTSVSKLLNLPGYSKSNKSDIVVPCNCKGNVK